MEEKQLFKIGEVSKMFHLSMSTLRHYENIGILIPEYIDEKTGYRYYGIHQFEVLNTIRYLRMLDLPLHEIEAFLKNRDVQTIQEKLMKQKDLIQLKIEELNQIQRKIENRLAIIEDSLHSKIGVIEEKTMPSIKMGLIKNQLHPTNYLDLEYSIRKLDNEKLNGNIYLGNVGIGISQERLIKKEYRTYDYVFIILDKDDVYEDQCFTIPENKYVCIRFRGGHLKAAQNYEKLLNYIQEKNYKINGFSQEITLIDNGLTADESLFVSEIRIPIVDNVNK